jgi:uncharacterized protein (DUF885 family)
MKRILVFVAIVMIAGCTVQPATNNSNTAPASEAGDAQFKTLHDKYVVAFLKRFPVVNTYLGGAGLDPSLKEVDGRLRDYSAQAIATEDQWLNDAKKPFESIDPNTLSAAHKIDRDVALAQISFLLHQHGVRRYQERAVDSFTDEPFRGVDWQLQGMTTIDEKGGKYGTADEWETIIKRLQAIPPYLRVAQDQLNAGIKSGNTPDWRMLKRNGIGSAEANAKYFAETLPQLAKDRVSGDKRDDIVNRLTTAAKSTAEAYTGFRDYIATTFFDGDKIKQQFGGDHYALGEDEYNWALKNNLRLNKTSSQLYDESWPVVQSTQREMVQLAREIGNSHKMTLPQDDGQAVLAVIDEMSKDYPKSDAELVGWYKDTGVRLVDYARKTGLFDVPADYKLDVSETPPPLRSSIDGAAYYPAPPFKNSGVGRFYVTTSGKNDVADLKKNNRASIADLSAHEGFPGHDWHYKVMTQFRDQISGVRWLTPGAVEDSSSMWEDSLAAEGWALYSEALMAEPQTGFPNGFYTPEEHFYQLQGKLYRDLRVRIDTGIHTGKLSYDDAVDLFSQIVDFEPGKCSDPGSTSKPSKRASCTSAEAAIFRYSKWPTQAITYRLGKEQIQELRKQAQERAGAQFSPKSFHLQFMKQGTIPPGYFRETLLSGKN